MHAKSFNTSKVATTLDDFWILSICDDIFVLIFTNSSYSNVTILSSAPKTLSSIDFNSSVINLSAPVSVCFLIYLSVGTCFKKDFVTSI